MCGADVVVGRAEGSDAVGRSLQIIEAVADLGVGTTAQEIAHRLGLPAATTYRLLNNLVADEYLVRTADLRGFALGTRLASLIGAVAGPRVPAAAREAIDRFRAGIRYGVHIVYFRPAAVRVLDTDPDHPLAGEPVLTRHLHATAPGKLLLASQSRWRDMLLMPLHPVTPSTITDRHRLTAVIDEVRRRGFAQDNRERADTAAAVAVPIMDSTGAIRGAVMISGLAERLDVITALVPQCRELATTLGPLLF